MISTLKTRIWTPQGYQFADDLYIGQKTISFNPARGVCEYDTINGVETKYMRHMGLGLNSKSMCLVLTPDHPLLMWNFKSKTLELVPIEERFMQNMIQGRDVSILNHALFEPYQKTQPTEDIEWSARLAATASKHRFAPINIDKVIHDLGGYESQLWLDTFFHWNVMLRASHCMGAVTINNKTVRDHLFNIAPRAGVGVKINLYKGKQVARMGINGLIYPKSKNNWFKRPIDEQMFNVTTKNGNVLVKASNGTSLVACNKGN